MSVMEKHSRQIVAPGLERFRDLKITAAEIANLNVAPKLLVPAPLDDHFLLFTGMTISKAANTVAFTAAGGDDIVVRYKDGNGTQLGYCESTGFITEATAQLRFVRAWVPASGASDLTPAAGEALVLHVLNQNFGAAGNAILRCRVFYKALPVSVAVGM